MALVYSCCFWFSLRLSGILIAIFSIMQGMAVLISCCIGYSHSQSVKQSTVAIINSMNLIYTRPYLENFQDDPEIYLSYGISLSCFYILICLLYAYGAYTFKNILMFGYILVEFLRLIALAFVITTWLLVLKENTMDIGVQIGTSVTGSFFLLGMLYLWICASNLPILINEFERDQQAATIYKLQQILNMKNTTITQGFHQPATVVTPIDLRSYDKPVITTSIERNKILKNSFEKQFSYPIYILPTL